MNYSAMIQNRRSVHAFREKEVPSEAIGQLRSYYEKTCPRLVPEIATELIVLDKDAQPALESSAGYKQFCFFFVSGYKETCTSPRSIIVSLIIIFFTNTNIFRFTFNNNKSGFAFDFILF